ncbi:pentatricopeptide repeat-containing protein At3g29230-like [Malania oleifera]|uniref:pentatricopeptide repeat-containing protein At3g29230-like n=1 Tax=Malania oleifera TaxID=397392 RepID=UPI0025ADC2FB|nr:pentatricopeptide repeat-containing protein At3g29230-like [Malania oleifera]
MAVRFKSSKPTASFSSRTLEKFIKTHRNLSKSSPRIWTDNEDDPLEVDLQGYCILNLNHPFLRSLDSCSGTMREFNQIQSQLIVSGIFQHPLATSRAVKKLCASPITAKHALSLFDSLEEPDAFICNTIMRSLVNFNDPHVALTFYYQQMVGKGVLPNHYTFPLVVKISAELGLVWVGEKNHALILKYGLNLDLFVRNSLIHMYSVCGRIGAARVLFDACSQSDLVTWNSMIDGYVKNGEVGLARELFDEMWGRDIFSWNSMLAGYVGIEDMKTAKNLFERMPFRDVVSWNCMIDGYARIGDIAGAHELFNCMPVQNVVSWNTMLALYVRFKDYDQCLRLFDRMKEGDVMPNEATLVSVLTACANLGRLDEGKWVHSYINNNRKIKPDVLLSTALLTMYAKCGAMDFASNVFKEMPEKSVVSWNSMIMGYGMHGHGKKALEVFLEMEKSGTMPNTATFVCILCACTHAGMVLEGWWYFSRMCQKYKIEPNTEHYGCMVDLLARAGLMKNSEEIITEMPMEAGPVLWGALLSACRTHSNLELGVIVAKRLIDLKQGDIGPYVLLSNMYAAEGKWDGVESVRKMIKEKGLQKAAGRSIVHIGDSGSEYDLESDSVHKKIMVYSMLTEMGAQMKLSYRLTMMEERK